MSEQIGIDRFVSFKEAARMLGVAGRTLERCVESGEVPRWRYMGRKRVYALSVVQGVIKKKTGRA